MPRDLLVAGESFEDLVFFGLSHLPRPGEELKTDRFVRSAGGGAVITAVAAARLGLATEVVSALHPTARATLEREAVAFRDLLRPGEAPALSVCLSTPAERSFVTYSGVNPSVETRLLRLLEDESLDERHVHGALFPGDCRAWTHRLRALREAGLGTSWDFGWNPALREDPAFFDLLGELDILFLNEAEAILYSARATLDEALAFWAERGRCTVVKLGPRGCAWVGREGSGSAAPPSVNVCDTTGAGDAFNGGFLYGRLRGMDLEASARLANRVGALSTRRPGGIDGIPRREELG